MASNSYLKENEEELPELLQNKIKLEEKVLEDYQELKAVPHYFLNDTKDLITKISHGMGELQ